MHLLIALETFWWFPNTSVRYLELVGRYKTVTSLVEVLFLNNSTMDRIERIELFHLLPKREERDSLVISISAKFKF